MIRNGVLIGSLAIHACRGRLEAIATEILRGGCDAVQGFNDVFSNGGTPD